MKASATSADRLQETFLYEVCQQTASVLPPSYRQTIRFNHHQSSLQVLTSSGERVVRVAHPTRHGSTPTVDIQSKNLSGRLQVISFPQKPHTLGKEAGNALKACLRSVELLQSVVKGGSTGTALEALTHMALGGGSGAGARVTRPVTGNVTGAVTSAVLRVAALEYPSVTWASADVDGYTPQVCFHS